MNNRIVVFSPHDRTYGEYTSPRISFGHICLICPLSVRSSQGSSPIDVCSLSGYFSIFLSIFEPFPLAPLLLEDKPVLRVNHRRIAQPGRKYELK